MESKTDNKKTAHDLMFENLDRFVHGELRFSSREMEKRFLKELAWVWTEFRDLENGGCQRAKFVTEYWSENALRKIYEISSKDTEHSIMVLLLIWIGIMDSTLDLFGDFDI